MALDREVTREINVTVNGRKYRTEVPANLLLQEFLKERLGLTGTKRGCGRGECGACTVIVNDRAVNACLTLAVECDGAKVETIEGEGAVGKLSDLQQAFIDEGAIQCGFCTPGMVMSAKALLRRTPSPSEDEIREAIAGNLCRCTGYETIVSAIRSVAGKPRRKARR